MHLQFRDFKNPKFNNEVKQKLHNAETHHNYEQWLIVISILWLIYSAELLTGNKINVLHAKIKSVIK